MADTMSPSGVLPVILYLSTHSFVDSTRDQNSQSTLLLQALQQNASISSSVAPAQGSLVRSTPTYSTLTSTGGHTGATSGTGAGVTSAGTGARVTLADLKRPSGPELA